MKRLAVLVLSPFLEICGDAMVRLGLRSFRIAAFVVGAALLFAYGLLVNITSLDFGRLMGAYIMVFFVVSQIISYFIFHEHVRPAIWVGGAFIVAGGVILTLWK